MVTEKQKNVTEIIGQLIQKRADTIITGDGIYDGKAGKRYESIEDQDADTRQKPNF